jgi:hypothetical protein
MHEQTEKSYSPDEKQTRKPCGGKSKWALSSANSNPCEYGGTFMKKQVTVMWDIRSGGRAKSSCPGAPIAACQNAAPEYIDEVLE